tara:strand:- start:2526 stop:3947 length:1422 start_codon:yes stop_codon:yes gene_type:complete
MSVAPNAINYGNQLPLGIEAKSQRRLFFPATGDTYTSNGNNIIRISLNYDGMLDTHQSYLKFDIQNTTNVAAAAGRNTYDLGQPQIARLVVSSGGVVLEDIQHYNHLVGGILAPCQYGDGQLNEAMTNAQCFASPQATLAGGVNTSQGGGKLGTLLYEQPQNAGIAARTAFNSVNVIDIGAANRLSMCYKLYSGLLDNEKYLPLVLMNNGLDIEIHLASGEEAGVSDAAANIPTYTISNVRYVAHLIDLQRDFYDMLRQTQQASGGVIQLAGQTFRSFTSPLANAAGQYAVNIPVRARSIKSVFFKASSSVADNQNYSLTGASNLFAGAAGGEYHLQIGATKYPPTAIQVKTDVGANKSEPYFELMKSFGKLGSTIHDNLLYGSNYLSQADCGLARRGGANGDGVIPFAPFGIDLETFRAEIENGIDTSSRALPMTLHLSKGVSGATAHNLFMYCMIDTLFFINMDGSVSVSS